MVDNCSKDKTNILRVAGLVDVLVTLKSQASLAGAWNAGISYSNTEYIVITNDDILFTKNWLPPLIASFEADKKLGVVQPFNTVGPLPAGFPFNFNPLNVVGPIPVDNFVGCCFAIRRDVIKPLKEVDKKRWPKDAEDYTYFYEKFYPIGTEDQDFNRRVQLAGYTIQTAFDSYVHHYSSETTKQLPNFASIKDQAIEIYRQRWGEEPVFHDFK